MMYAALFIAFGIGLCVYVYLESKARARRYGSRRDKIENVTYPTLG